MSDYQRALWAVYSRDQREGGPQRRERTYLHYVDRLAKHDARKQTTPAPNFSRDRAEVAA